MYLNLFHNGKKYIYETGNNLNIGHLKEISEGILKSNKNILQIIYDNPSTYHKYINPKDKTYLRDLIPKGQRRAQFSIRLNSGNSESNINQKQNTKTSTNGIGKNIFGNFSYMYSAQKKFNMLITNKYNELLLEIRELIRRINQVYEEIYKSFEQSNLNYSRENSKNNKNDVNNKMKQITEYEFHMIKFIEKEKSFFSKINSVLKQCLLEQNGKTIISNKATKELYKNIFTDNTNEFKLYLNEKKDYISNIIENPFKNEEKKNITKSKNNISSEDEIFYDKIYRSKSRKFLHSLSSLNMNNNNNNKINNNEFSYNNFNKNDNSNFNFNTNDFRDNNTIKLNNKSNKRSSLKIKKKNSNLMISTEVGPDGVQRGKILLFSEEKKHKKEIDSQINKEKNIKIKGEEESGNDENSNSKLNLIKNRLNFRNNKAFGFSSFKTNFDNKNNMNRFSSEDVNKNKKNEIEINTQKNISNKTDNINVDKDLNKHNKDNIKELKIPSVTAHENLSDSTEYLNNNKTNKNNSNIDLNKIENNNKNNNNNDNNNDSNNHVTNEKEGKNNDAESNNIDNNKNSNKISKKEINKDKIDENNNINNNKNLNDITNNDKLLDNNNDNENLDSLKKTKKKKKVKKERKKRRNSSDENDNSSGTGNESEKEKRKSGRKKNNSIDEDSKESERPKKRSTKDLFDLHLLKNLSVDKDNPYKKAKIPAYGNGIKKVKENELIRPEIPESEDSEEEKKRLALVKKKKKNHIKNKYDFLI